MAITQFEKNMAIISALDDEPNDVGGLSAAELKAKFDEGGEALKEYINDTLIPQAEEAIENASISSIHDGGIPQVKLAPDVSAAVDRAKAGGAIDEAVAQKVSKSGDTMTGDLAINKDMPGLHLKRNGQSWIAALMKNASGTADYGTILADYASDGSHIDFVVCALNKTIQAAFVDANVTPLVVDILHTGNKPFGTYAGTGATQAIDTKGVGNICVIWRSDNAVFCIVTPSGALSVVTHESAPSVAPYLWSHISFVNGVINLVDANPNFNASGATYYFQVL